MSYDDDGFREVVDKAIETGRHRSPGYDVEFFAGALWTAKPFLEALAPLADNDEMRAFAHRFGVEMPPSAFTETELRRAKRLAIDLFKAVTDGSKHNLLTCMSKIRGLAQAANIPMPVVRLAPIRPKATTN